jgi:hypothetical protein
MKLFITLFNLFKNINEMEMLKFEKILMIADLWKSIGGISKIEIGALEPLL